MKTAVVYLTKSGHSRKIAQAIATELQVPAEDIKTNPKLSGIDLLFVVGGIYAGTSDPQMIAYIKGVDNSMVKKAALVTSCASKRRKQGIVREALQKNNIDVISDEFVCAGSFLFMRIGHPDQTDIANAVSYAKGIVKTLA
jgi:menaquinone-dependent protoporphyrinogen IX oxidase